MKDKKLRIEDALSATKAAVEEVNSCRWWNSICKHITRSRKICKWSTKKKKNLEEI